MVMVTNVELDTGQSREGLIEGWLNHQSKFPLVPLVVCSTTVPSERKVRRFCNTGVGELEIMLKRLDEHLKHLPKEEYSTLMLFEVCWFRDTPMFLDI